ncbi:MAG: hypothetical protein COW73_01990 [Nitrospirae bacterium CG18_big_fil_WC_8_21_14_2_50_70_55]|nr:hypothetical protein [Deltaproteobacteria bacterium]OIP64787.1 MAG: hypothetical protein AUK30_06090 [Nitrospirae bacterium CG2_30_70_394]PIQ06886.1 MAG: hypothetical protein COW73_01990 [Nitrospirae bacterium CG18_big_fil_WC_8_21_14_2_50_70_55]PIU80276.1 MAG: hypothetical protein COS73_00080 [Nitrospirae bacterium CG06_land_8_20_14_3_00_70_43]PIW82647.1 MAG: hypothetical protein COZ96_07615 [Nitrospirae bacterium CG_4_8_14_3_um_filter_70_85]PIX82933.1 MAG: hypothetical protein COZ33_08075 
MAPRNPLIAALLSAAVLPGVGQLYLGRPRLGAALIVATTAALLLTVAGAATALSHLTLTPPFTPEQLRGAVAQITAAAGPPLRGGTLLLAAAWVVGVADALWPRRGAGAGE